MILHFVFGTETWMCQISALGWLVDGWGKLRREPRAAHVFFIFQIVTIATTTYTASIFTTTPRPPGLAHNSYSSLGGGGAPSWKRQGDLE